LLLLPPLLLLLLSLQTWAVLYGVMGTASYLVGKQAGWHSYPIAVYAAQLLLNLAWQPIFFLLKRPGVAQVENASEALMRLPLFVVLEVGCSYSAAGPSGLAADVLPAEAPRRCTSAECR
jgi:tryptophan-rich sensory protein